MVQIAEFEARRKERLSAKQLSVTPTKSTTPFSILTSIFPPLIRQVKSITNTLYKFVTNLLICIGMISQ